MTTSLAHLSRLEALVGPAHATRGDGLARYRLGGCIPALALHPADEGEVSRILALAWELRLAVIPWGSGLHQGMGRLPERYDLALDLGRMDRLVAHEIGDMTATAQAGLCLERLAERIAPHGQLFPLDPPRGEGATLGGVLAANLSGPLRGRYGTARDLVLGLRIVHADGTVTKGGGRVVKNVSAYDIPKLYLGAFGTLGVIVEATVRLYPRCEEEIGDLWLLPDPAAAQALAERLLHSAVVPTRLELLDSGAAHDLLGQRVGAALVISIAGIPEAVASQRRMVAEMAAAHGGRAGEAAVAPDLFRQIADFPWHGPADGNLTLRWRAGLLPADCAKGLQAMAAAAAPTGRMSGMATVSAGMLRGVACSQDPDGLVAAFQAARRACETLGGYLVLLEAPDAVRSRVDPWGPPPASLALMQGLRAEFDGRAVINPGRFLTGL
jgi:glycolate oxidase FAD binding subunit